MRLHAALLAVPILCCACTSAPQRSSDREAVLAVVQQFFDAMHARDPQAAARVLVPDGSFVNTRRIDGRRVERHFTNREWIDKLAQEHTLLLEEFTGTPEVRIAGDLATVWCSYRFTIDGKPSHTGVDALDLVRTDAGWRISGGAYSVVKPGS